MNQSNISYGATVLYPTVMRFGAEICSFLLQRGVLWGVRWEHCAFYEIGLVASSILSCYLFLLISVPQHRDYHVLS